MPILSIIPVCDPLKSACWATAPYFLLGGPNFHGRSPRLTATLALRDVRAGYRPTAAGEFLSSIVLMVRLRLLGRKGFPEGAFHTPFSPKLSSPRSKSAARPTVSPSCHCCAPNSFPCPRCHSLRRPPSIAQLWLSSPTPWSVSCLMVVSKRSG